MGLLLFVRRPAAWQRQARGLLSTSAGTAVMGRRLIIFKSRFGLHTQSGNSRGHARPAWRVKELLHFAVLERVIGEHDQTSGRTQATRAPRRVRERNTSISRLTAMRKA